jgi:hypothetical protein
LLVLARVLIDHLELGIEGHGFGDGHSRTDARVPGSVGAEEDAGPARRGGIG